MRPSLIRHVPNILTLGRIAMVPFVLAFMAMDTATSRIIAVALFVFAALTDALDGILARKYAWTSLTGKFLDPLADKLFVIAIGVALVELHRVPAWAIILLIMRELSITGLRLLALSEGLVLEVSTQGKWKTAIQMVALALLVLHRFDWPSWHSIPTHNVGLWLFYGSLILAGWSGFKYAMLFFRSSR